MTSALVEEKVKGKRGRKRISEECNKIIKRMDTDTDTGGEEGVRGEAQRTRESIFLHSLCASAIYATYFRIAMRWE